MKDIKIYTHGFPDGTFRKQAYFFHIIGNDIFIPNESIGRDSLGEPLFAEQMKWLMSFEKEGLEYGGCGRWACKKETLLEKIIEKLQMVENFKGVYSVIGYHRNDAVSNINQVVIGSEAQIEQITFKEASYNHYEELIEEKNVLYEVFNQSYAAETGILSLTTNHIIAMKKLRFYVDLPNNTFTSDYQ